MPHRIVLVDDHHMVRQGLVQLVGGHPDYVVAGEARTAAEAIDVVGEDPPDMVIADLVLGSGPDGIHLTRALKSEHPLLPVLVLSGRDESLFAERALLAGAAGYLMKDEAVDVLFSAIQVALNGGVWLSEAMADRLLPRELAAGATPANLVDGSPEARLVAELRGGNRTVLGLSRALGWGPDAVERALDQLREELGLPSRASMFLYLQR